MKFPNTERNQTDTKEHSEYDTIHMELWKDKHTLQWWKADQPPGLGWEARRPEEHLGVRKGVCADRDGGYAGALSCQNSQQCILNCLPFIVHKSYLKL